MDSENEEAVALVVLTAAFLMPFIEHKYNNKHGEGAFWDHVFSVVALLCVGLMYLIVGGLWFYCLAVVLWRNLSW